MGGFSFDMSGLMPLMNAYANRALQATDYKLGQMPVEDRLNRRAYAEWLNNNAHKRALAEREATGREAAQALAMRQSAANERRMAMAEAEASPAGRMRHYQTMRNLSSMGPRYSYSQGMADQAARHMTWGGAPPLTYGR